MDIKDIIKLKREELGLTYEELGKMIGVGKSTVRNMNKTVEKAIEMDKFNNSLPEVEIGDVISLGEVWDGEGETPGESYSYLLTNDGEDGGSNYPVSINYEFELVEESENPLETTVKITDITLI